MRRRSLWARLALAVVGVLALLWLLSRIAMRPVAPHPWFAARADDHAPLLIAHQGGEGLWPSNTMLAFEESAALGADVLDSDMHMTRDGVLVLMHDQTVDRTTEGSGAIRDLTLADLQRLDAGYDFTTDDGATFPYRGKGIMVPTLGELFARFPDYRFGIEIKQTDPEPTARAFCDLIRRHGMEDQVLVSSFRQANMDAFRAACPAVATSATEDEVRWFYILFRLGTGDPRPPQYESLQIPEESGGIHLLTPSLIAAAHQRGLAVQPWTINESDDLRRIIGMGVDGINTDFPDRFLDAITP